jgi:HTH-type transcriptional regulator/antitoxin HigA
MESMKPFRSVLVKLEDFHDVTVKDDIVYTGKFPLGVLWSMNKDFVEVQNASFIKITNPGETFNPDWASKPGDTIIDIMEEKNISQEKFLEMMNLPSIPISGLFDGSTEISPEIAERLSKVLGSTSEFWINREKQYHKSSRSM